MCTYFACLSCRNNFVNRCKKAPFESAESCAARSFGMDFAECYTCHIVNNAISQLDSLVWRAPFLQTKGLSGLDDVSSWEKRDLQAMLIKPKDQKSWEDEAESREERHSLARKLERMGLKDPQNCSVNHQGFGMAITPDKSDDSQESGEDSDKDSIKIQATRASATTQ